MEMEMEDYGGIVSPAARRNSVKYRRTGEDEKQKGGSPTSEAARETAL
jgi:hypothetical protein